MTKLGWHLVRNPGQQHLLDPSVNRQELEKQFFRTENPWKTLDVDRVGVGFLRDQLKEVLSGLVRREFPKVSSIISEIIIS